MKIPESIIHTHTHRDTNKRTHTHVKQPRVTLPACGIDCWAEAAAATYTRRQGGRKQKKKKGKKDKKRESERERASKREREAKGVTEWVVLLKIVSRNKLTRESLSLARPITTRH